MAFEGLGEKLNATFKRLRGKGRLTEADVREGMREVRMALLEADVSYKVVKDFVASVTEKCVGADVLDSLTPRSADHQDRQRGADGADGRHQRPSHHGLQGPHRGDDGGSSGRR